MASNLSVSAAEFDAKVLNSDKPVLVDFWASWCGPCKAIAPAIEQLAVEYAGKADVYKLDVDEAQEAAAKFGVMSIPAVFIFKGGQVVDKYVGAAPKAHYAAMLDRAL